MQKKLGLWALSAFLICTAAQAIGYQAPPLDRPKYIRTEDPRDHEITQEIRQKILDDYYLAPYSDQVSIQTQNGIVVLNGYLRSHRIKLSMEDKARQVKGVKRIDNNIAVDPTPPYTPPL